MTNTQNPIPPDANNIQPKVECFFYDGMLFSYAHESYVVGLKSLQKGGQWNTSLFDVEWNNGNCKWDVNPTTDLKPEIGDVVEFEHQKAIIKALKQSYNYEKEVAAAFTKLVSKSFYSERKLYYDSLKNIALDKEVIDKANEIEKNGNVEQYLLDALEKYHSGDVINKKFYIRALLSMNEHVAYLLNMWCLGRAGSGKSYCQEVFETVCVPFENRLPVNSMSPTALNYAAAKYSFIKKVIRFDDITDNDASVIKAYAGNGAPKSRWTVQNGVLLEQNPDGLPLFLITRVSPIKDEGNQVGRRFIFTNTEDSEAHSESIAEKIKNNRSKKQNVKVVPDAVCQELMRRRIEYNGKVIIEFKYNSPDNDPSQVNQFHTLIETSALLNYNKREIREVASSALIPETQYHIIATQEDYDNALAMWKHVQNQNKFKISQDQSIVYSALIPEIEASGVKDKCTLENIEFMSKPLKPRAVRDALYKLKEMHLAGSNKFPSTNKYYWFKTGDTELPNWYKCYAASKTKKNDASNTQIPNGLGVDPRTL